MTLTSGKPASAGEKRAALAWNGLRFLVPESWEPVRLGRDYLGLESPAGPVMEARWRGGAGNLDPGDVARRMFSRSPHPCRIDDAAVPSSWLAALAGRKNAAFAISGYPPSRGVASLCRHCGTLVVLRFFDTSEGRGGVAEGLAREVLDSLADHDGPDTEFALYGIRLAVPGGYRLQRFSFKPGRFDLEFSGPGRTLAFSRFAPADVVLGREDLAAFAGRHLVPSGARWIFVPCAWRGMAAALAVFGPGTGLWGLTADAIGRVFRRRRQARAMIWHEEAVNKLAAVVWCGV
ncbi:MAG: hypothetical protein GYA47_15075, partial [Desulfovibrio sp.]|nr:hypothetical protein [Desulfovibrio sp.]